ncbi:t-SNARE domain-containing protein 1 [Liparis tanakae]|uniref:t-SNARE domain-containing protein 1 n=1 Tax=Liparis tanakae TaxID=230148 RepID=A0A4Z2JFJ7_9TELE|nr:t-SNARE domain-containing protein 1 [Liparis tanakae]
MQQSPQTPFTEQIDEGPLFGEAVGTEDLAQAFLSEISEEDVEVLRQREEALLQIERAEKDKCLSSLSAPVSLVEKKKKERVLFTENLSVRQSATLSTGSWNLQQAQHSRSGSPSACCRAPSGDRRAVEDKLLLDEHKAPKVLPFHDDVGTRFSAA